MNIEQARFNMIQQQIRPWDVLEPRVLAALAAVHREQFVPPAMRALAFTDTELPLPHGHGEVMLAPRLEARLIQSLQLRRSDRVLEIGAGSGHMAALMGHLAAEVTTLERWPDLADWVTQQLRRANVRNVQVVHANGSEPIAEGASYDAILLCGAVAQVPPFLLQQLRPGGRLVAIVGEEPIMSVLRWTRAGDGALLPSESLFDTLAPALHGFDLATSFRF